MSMIVEKNHGENLAYMNKLISEKASIMAAGLREKFLELNNKLKEAMKTQKETTTKSEIVPPIKEKPVLAPVQV